MSPDRLDEGSPGPMIADFDVRMSKWGNIWLSLIRTGTRLSFVGPTGFVSWRSLSHCSESCFLAKVIWEKCCKFAQDEAINCGYRERLGNDVIDGRICSKD